VLSLPVAGRSIQRPAAHGKRLRESIACISVGKYPCTTSLQDNNVVVKTWGTPREEPELLNHVDLVAKLGIADLEKGTAVAGAGFSF
jgi:seryl-tRNA synthetase